MPQPAQLTKAMRRLGSASFDENADVDELVKEALDAGKIQVAWSFVQFNETPCRSLPASRSSSPTACPTPTPTGC